jgi:hypothetical protein
MTSRITFLLIALFWLTMTYLLWKSEYEGHNQVGSRVPVELVWRKILTAPDDSSLQIIHQGTKVGFCKWISGTGKMLTEDAPEGMMETIKGYHPTFDGSLFFNDGPGRVQFTSELQLATNNTWQEFNLRVTTKPAAYAIHSRASEETIRLTVSDKQSRWERVFKFSEFQNPQALAEELGFPAAIGMLGELNPLSSAKSQASLLPELIWTARNDWITIGHTSVRAYRLEASLLDRYRMRIIVSSVGEIVRVELPDGWEMINSDLISL